MAEWWKENFDEEEENERVIAGATRRLKPGGLLLIDVIHRDPLLWRGVARRWEELEHHSLLEECSAELTINRWHSQQWLIPKDGGSPTR